MKKRPFASGILLLLAGAWSVHAADFFFDSAGVRLHYIVEGKGEPVVLIHGFGVDIDWNWEGTGIIKGLADNYQVIALDNRGHGRSEKPHDPGQYGGVMVSDIVRLLDHLKIKKTHVIGYSMGGRITLALLAGHPGRLRTAVIGGAGWSDTEDIRTRQALMNQLAESLEQGKGAGPLFIALTPRGEQPPTPEQIEAINKMFLARNDALALAAVVRAMAGIQPAEARLRANKVPALAVVGELDPNKAGVDKLARVTRNLKVLVIPAANHMNAVGNPQFLEALKTFLAAHSGK